MTDGRRTETGAAGTDETSRQTAVDARYRRILDRSTDYFLIVDADGVIRYASPAVTETLGYPPERLVDTDAFGYIHHDDRSRVIETFRSMLSGSEPRTSVEYRVETAAGDYRWTEARGTDCLDDPLIEGMLVAVRDVTDRKRDQRRIAAQNRLLERLARIISHDLSTPVATAQTLVALLRADLDAPAEPVERNLSSLEAVLDELSTFSEYLPQLAQRGTEIETPTDCPVDVLCIHAWRAVDTGPLTLDIRTDRSLSGDRRRLVQVFQNLFANVVEHAVDGADAAADAPGADAETTAGADAGGGDHADAAGSAAATTVTVGEFSAGVFVEDDGPGFGAVDRETLFEYDTGTDGRSGIGLAIARTVVEAHGWEIRAVDGTAGGARFEILTD